VPDWRMMIANNRASRFITLFLLCVAAALLNWGFSLFVFHVLTFPLFVNTIFTAAVTFHAGLVPGIAVIVINRLFRLVEPGGMSLFILVSIVEVIIIWRLRPELTWPGLRGSRALAQTVNILWRLALLYVAASLTASVLGGLIGFYYILAEPEMARERFSPNTVFQTVFYDGGIHQLATSILSRIPINLIDRAIVVFGGYFVALGIRRLMDRPVSGKGNRVSARGRPRLFFGKVSGNPAGNDCEGR